jgi:hypothetical protein
MEDDLAEKCESLHVVEKKIIELSGGGFVGSFETWTLLDTINHACAWKKTALQKIELRLDGKEVDFHDKMAIDLINRSFYEESRNRSKERTLKNMVEIADLSRRILRMLSGREDSEDISPIGFSGPVGEYLRYDLLFHPINHYIFYSIKNNEYGMFLEIERYVAKNRRSVFKDLSVLDFSGFCGAQEYVDLFTRGYEWQNDDLYIHLKSKIA